jgi:hypothetical protein
MQGREKDKRSERREGWHGEPGRGAERMTCKQPAL